MARILGADGKEEGKFSSSLIRLGARVGDILKNCVCRDEKLPQ
jgi:hypothetical protein